MVYCPKCGVENPASSRFCDQCGAALIQVPASAPVAPKPIAPAPVFRPVQSVAPLPPAAASVGVEGRVVCPQCGASAIPGEAFCDNCGAPLSSPAPSAAVVPMPPYSPGLAPQPVYPAPQPASPAPPPAYTPPSTPVYVPPAASVAPPVNAPVRAVLAPARLTLDDGTVLHLPSISQAIIGRADPVSNYQPDLDLSNHGAISSGVGRRHARIFVQDNAILVEDLDSTNGSSVNGARLQARKPQLLQSNDIVQFGSLRLRFSS